MKGCVLLTLFNEYGNLIDNNIRGKGNWILDCNGNHNIGVSGSSSRTNENEKREIRVIRHRK
jgi:hypothetical protein